MSAYRTIYLNSIRKFSPMFQAELDKQVRVIVKGDIPGSKGIRDMIALIHGSLGTLMAERTAKAIRRQSNQKATPQEIWQQVILAYLEMYGLDKVAADITQTTIDDVTRFLGKIADEGWNINQIINYIEEKGYTRYRGELIARTETAKAAGTGQMVGALSTGLQTRKEWIAIQDRRTRQAPEDQFDHYHMDGVQVGVDEYFEVPSKNGPERMLYPGDPAGSAGDVCNCRCTCGYEVVRDSAGVPVKLTSAPMGNAGIIYNILNSQSILK